jgi:hypothetical protein
VKRLLRSLTAAAWTGPEVAVPDGVVLVPPDPPVTVPVPVDAAVASELEAEGRELVGADPVTEGPEVGDCPELAEASEEVKPDDVLVSDVWVAETEVSEAEPEVDDGAADSEAEEEVDREELLDSLVIMLVDWLEAWTCDEVATVWVDVTSAAADELLGSVAAVALQKLRNCATELSKYWRPLSFVWS